MSFFVKNHYKCRFNDNFRIILKINCVYLSKSRPFLSRVKLQIDKLRFLIDLHPYIRPNTCYKTNDFLHAVRLHYFYPDSRVTIRPKIFDLRLEDSFTVIRRYINTLLLLLLRYLTQSTPFLSRVRLSIDKLWFLQVNDFNSIQCLNTCRLQSVDLTKSVM